ncbi:MAG: cyclic lactone autoinducer peptide [Butyrivibrio sp.]|nr:cyclic lactone autoinducer peptide [Butyrivibrio sp.]
MKRERTFIAKMLKGIAQTSVMASIDRRCIYIMHQPKMPSDIGEFSKK